MPPSPKYELRRSRDGQYYFILKAANGKVILQSETYKTRSGARKGIAAIRNAVTAADIVRVEDHT